MKIEILRANVIEMSVQADLLNFVIASRNKMETHRWNGFCKSLKPEFFEEVKKIESFAVQLFLENLDLYLFQKEFFSLFSF